MIASYKVNKPVSVIVDYLTDMDKFVSVHPVINRMKKIGDNKYLVYETLKLGGIPFSFTYKTTIQCDQENKHIIMKAVVMGLTKINISFRVSQEIGYTFVDEKIDFRSVLPVKNIMTNIFRKQHAQFFKNIEDLK